MHLNTSKKKKLKHSTARILLIQVWDTLIHLPAAGETEKDFTCTSMWEYNRLPTENQHKALA
jgi:hypothetical protein